MKFYCPKCGERITFIGIKDRLGLNQLDISIKEHNIQEKKL